MRKLLHLLTLLILCLSSSRLQAQEPSKAELEEEAYGYFNDKDYSNAYKCFDKLNAKYPTEFDYLFKLGVCCLHYAEKKSRAIEIFEAVRKESKGPEGDYYLGKAFHVNYRFSEAIPLLESYLKEKEKNAKKIDKEMMDDAKVSVNNCKNGIMLINNKVIADIKNIGSPVNTEELEGSPIITTDESIVIFTYAGKKSTGGKLDDKLKPDPLHGMYREDIFMSIKGADSLYSEPKAIESLNTLGNDAAIALSPDGNTLFTFSSNNDAGDISVSTLNGTEWSKPVKLNKHINTEAWEGSCSISADGRHLYFASERAGGQGGRDIYVSDWDGNDWGPAKNLGPKINTPLNDDAPFIHPDGITLFFSSQGHMSIGGYDIMFSIKRDNEWLDPKSMGLPLNTTEDDRYYVINSRGDKGFFSSDRGGAGGKGNQDIYMVTPGILGEKPVIALLKGVVYGDDKPIEASIEVTKISLKESIGPFLTNKKSGKYLMALSPGYVYRLKVVANGFEPLEEDLDIENLNKYMESQKDFYLYSPTNSVAATPTATPTETVAKTPTVAPTPTVAETPTVVPTPTVAETPTVVAVTPTVAPTPTVSETPTVAITPTVAETPTVAVTPTVAETPTVAATPTVPPTETVATTPTVMPEKTVAVVPTETLAEKAAPCATMPLPDFLPLKGRSLNDPEIYKQLLSVAGNYCADGLIFKVQIAAYRKPENYKYGHLAQFGKPEVLDYPDGITRFTQKQFTTINEAEKFRQKAIAKGQKDAWIVAFFNGKRYTLEELIMVDFLGKSIN